MFFLGGGEMGGRPLPLGFHWQTLKINGIFGGGVVYIGWTALSEFYCVLL